MDIYEFEPYTEKTPRRKNQHSTTFGKFLERQMKILASKYPFLSKEQIKSKARDQWRKCSGKPNKYRKHSATKQENTLRSKGKRFNFTAKSHLECQLFSDEPSDTLIPIPVYSKYEFISYPNNNYSTMEQSESKKLGILRKNGESRTKEFRVKFMDENKEDPLNNSFREQDSPLTEKNNKNYIPNDEINYLNIDNIQDKFTKNSSDSNVKSNKRSDDVLEHYDSSSESECDVLQTMHSVQRKMNAINNNKEKVQKYDTNCNKKTHSDIESPLDIFSVVNTSDFKNKISTYKKSEYDILLAKYSTQNKEKIQNNDDIGSSNEKHSNTESPLFLSLNKDVTDSSKSKESTSNKPKCDFLQANHCTEAKKQNTKKNEENYDISCNSRKLLHLTPPVSISPAIDISDNSQNTEKLTNSDFSFRNEVSMNSKTNSDQSEVQNYLEDNYSLEMLENALTSFNEQHDSYNIHHAEKFSPFIHEYNEEGLKVKLKNIGNQKPIINVDNSLKSMFTWEDNAICKSSTDEDNVLSPNRNLYIDLNRRIDQMLEKCSSPNIEFETKAQNESIDTFEDEDENVYSISGGGTSLMDSSYLNSLMRTDTEDYSTDNFETSIPIDENYDNYKDDNNDLTTDESQNDTDVTRKLKLISSKLFQFTDHKVSSHKANTEQNGHKKKKSRKSQTLEDVIEEMRKIGSVLMDSIEVSKPPDTMLDFDVDYDDSLTEFGSQLQTSGDLVGKDDPKNSISADKENINTTTDKDNINNVLSDGKENLNIINKEENADDFLSDDKENLKVITEKYVEKNEEKIRRPAQRRKKVTAQKSKIGFPIKHKNRNTMYKRCNRKLSSKTLVHPKFAKQRNFFRQFKNKEKMSGRSTNIISGPNANKSECKLFSTPPKVNEIKESRLNKFFNRGENRDGGLKDVFTSNMNIRNEFTRKPLSQKDKNYFLDDDIFSLSSENDILSPVEKRNQTSSSSSGRGILCELFEA